MDPPPDDDPMMPTQNRMLAAAPMPQMGELLLLQAILERALDDIANRCGCHSPYCGHTGNANDAADWMADDAIHWGSFAFICHLLRLDPAAVRRRAKERR